MVSKILHLLTAGIPKRTGGSIFQALVNGAYLAAAVVAAALTIIFCSGNIYFSSVGAPTSSKAVLESERSFCFFIHPKNLIHLARFIDRCYVFAPPGPDAPKHFLFPAYSSFSRVLFVLPIHTHIRNCVSLVLECLFSTHFFLH